MWNRKLLLSAIVASTLTAAVPCAQAAVDVFVSIPPPPLRYEVTPAPRAGYIWAPGYWDWRGQRHYWVRGHWERERHGSYYHPSRWEERDGRWVIERGRWADRPLGDRDRDGVPNFRDRAPDNPYRN